MAYTYEKNMTGDIIGLLDSDNNEVVAYTYNSWGKLLGMGGNISNKKATITLCKMNLNGVESKIGPRADKYLYAALEFLLSAFS